MYRLVLACLLAGVRLGDAQRVQKTLFLLRGDVGGA